MIFDDTLLKMPQTFAGLEENAIVIINTTKNIEELNLPDIKMKVYTVDATGIALETIEKDIPNTAMLGAFAKATELVNWYILKDKIKLAFNEDNVMSAQLAFEKVKLSN